MSISTTLHSTLISHTITLIPHAYPSHPSRTSIPHTHPSHQSLTLIPHTHPSYYPPKHPLHHSWHPSLTPRELMFGCITPISQHSLVPILFSLHTFFLHISADSQNPILGIAMVRIPAMYEAKKQHNLQLVNIQACNSANNQTPWYILPNKDVGLFWLCYITCIRKPPKSWDTCHWVLTIPTFRYSSIAFT